MLESSFLSFFKTYQHFLDYLITNNIDLIKNERHCQVCIRIWKADIIIIVNIIPLSASVVRAEQTGWSVGGGSQEFGQCHGAPLFDIFWPVFAMLSPLASDFNNAWWSCRDCYVVWHGNTMTTWFAQKSKSSIEATFSRPSKNGDIDLDISTWYNG